MTLDERIDRLTEVRTDFMEQLEQFLGAAGAASENIPGLVPAAESHAKQVVCAEGWRS